MPEKNLIHLGSCTVYETMCFDGCGAAIGTNLDSISLPENCKLLYDAEPSSLGEQYFSFYLDTQGQENADGILEKIKKSIGNTGFILGDPKEKQKPTQRKNAINIMINLGSASLATILFWFAPHAWPLTLALSALAFITTAFTGRSYLKAFYQNIKQKNYATMPSVITTGWLLAIAHGIYHIARMPVMHDYSMVFMTFIMPICLFLILNFMDFIRESMAPKVQRIQSDKDKNILGFSPTYKCKNTNAFEFTERPKAAIDTDMEITIAPDQVVPADSILLSPNACFDTSVIDGKLNKQISENGIVPSGAINRSKYPITIHTVATPYNSTANQVMMRANRADNGRSTSYQRFGMAFVAVYLFCLIAALAIPGVMGDLTPGLGMQNMLGILFAICPCTLVIAHKFPSLLLTGKQDKQNITIRDRDFFSYAPTPQTIVFDKTGTLTTGESEVSDVTEIDDPLLAKVVALEESIGAHHPIGKAIISFGDDTGHEASDAVYDEQHRGISGMVKGAKILIGNEDYLKANGVDTTEFSSKATAHPSLTPIFIAENGNCKAIIFINHPLRTGVIDSLHALKAQGKKIILLTGDSEKTAHAFNEQLGGIFETDNIVAGKTPAEKEQYTKSLKEKVWFVGDGLNDTPCARIVSENGGVSCAIEANTKAAYFTDIALNGSLDYLTKASEHQQQHDSIVQQNQGFLMLNGLLILGGILFAGIQGFALPPMAPMSIMLLTTVFTLSNSYRVNNGIGPLAEVRGSEYGPPALTKMIPAASVSNGNGTGLQLGHQPHPPVGQHQASIS